MSLHSKYFDKIRITRAPGVAPAAVGGNNCHWKGCKNAATHRAPMGRKREGEFYRFCIDHVREYNKTYNYFSGLDDDSIARFHKDAATGHRPTWAMGVNPAADVPPPNGSNPFESATARIRARLNGRLAAERTRKPKTLEKKALDDLGLPHSATGDQVKARYKELVKRHHPDSNGGDRSSEDRLRRIIQAYKFLKQAGFC
jgi:curved DNA-binding protein CbpA